jgi:hypothetical protein
MSNSVKEMQEKYAIGIYLAITGAFDHPWWPTILKERREMKGPRNIHRTIKEFYFE